MEAWQNCYDKCYFQIVQNIAVHMFVFYIGYKNI
jgi:TRAP-type uncharacterized transport system fused permease subunit